MQTGALVALDAFTIYYSGPIALTAQAISRSRRAWAIAEVAGAIGSIATTTQSVDPNSSIGKAITYFNLGMAAVGVKNLVMPRKIPDVIENMEDAVARGHVIADEPIEAVVDNVIFSRSEIAQSTELNSVDKAKILKEELTAPGELTSTLPIGPKEKLVDLAKKSKKLEGKSRASAHFSKKYDTFASKLHLLPDEVTKAAYMADVIRAQKAGNLALLDILKTDGGVRAWGAIFPDEFLRNNPNKLAKVYDYATDFGKSFDDIGDEFANVPAAQRSGWVDHLEFRTKSSGHVNKAGDRATDFNKFQNNPDVPQKYLDDESRFNALASDPDQGGAIKPGTRREATAGLELESQGIVSEITRGPKGIEFYDANRVPWDVKTPYGNFFKVTNTVETPPGSRGIGDAIFDELTKSKTIDGVTHPPGQFIDEISGVAKDKKVILDSSYISQQQLDELRSWLQNSSGLNSAQLSRIVEVNVLK